MQKLRTYFDIEFFSSSLTIFYKIYICICCMPIDRHHRVNKMYGFVVFWENLPIHYDWQGHDDCSKYLLLYILQQARVTPLSLLIPIFLLTYSRKPQGRHRHRKESANSKCLLNKKKEREEREGQFAFFFVTNCYHHPLFKRLILIDDR